MDPGHPHPGRLDWNQYTKYLASTGVTATSTQASVLWREAQAAAGIERNSPAKKRRERAAKVRAATSKGIMIDTELKRNVELEGREAAFGWEGFSNEQKIEVEARLANDEAFADAFVEAIGSTMRAERKSLGLEEPKDVADDDETKEEAEEEADRIVAALAALEETDDYAGEETKDDTGDSDTGEETKEAEISDPSLKRTAPMDDDERKTALRFLLGNYADRDSLVDNMGLPLGKEQLLTLAQLTPIWGALDDQQKQMFISESGTFASGREYAATARRLRKPKNIRRTLQTSSGQVIFI